MLTHATRRAHHAISRSRARAIEPPVVAAMASQLRHDFGDVRVHTDAVAADSARELGTNAYALGNDIVFGAGRYAPRTVPGARLLAHELTHVVQQRRGLAPRVQRQDPTSTAPEEREAEQAADKVTPPAPAKPIPSCNRTILAEGTCEHLACKSKFGCCNPESSIHCDAPASDAPCPSGNFSPLFTCDSTCAKAIEKGCSDSDNWMAIPGDKFTRAACGGIYTICANGRRTTGYVRDRSITATSYEVSPGIQTALGVTPGSTFKGAIYRPDAAQSAIDADACCGG
jgi:hypothetical protein